jgi:hypothetical protein
MSVVVSAVSPGLNAEMYEATTSRVMPGDQLPDGCELHIGGPVEQGWRVITVWESREAFGRFREEKHGRCGRMATHHESPTKGGLDTGFRAEARARGVSFGVP